MFASIKNFILNNADTITTVGKVVGGVVVAGAAVTGGMMYYKARQEGASEGTTSADTETSATEEVTV